MFRNQGNELTVETWFFVLATILFLKVTLAPWFDSSPEIGFVADPIELFCRKGETGNWKCGNWYLYSFEYLQQTNKNQSGPATEECHLRKKWQGNGTSMSR